MSSAPNTTTEPASQSIQDRVARVLTEVCAPWVLVMLLPIAVAWQATGYRLLPTLGWGVLVAATSSLIPQGVITWGARRGRWDGHHVRNRAGRLVPFVALIVSGLGGLAVLWLAGAPWPLIALDIGMNVLLLVTGAITVKWKVSMHAAAAGGATVVLAVFYGPLWWLLAVLTAAISWSRVQVRDHTPAQVTVGALLGAILIGGGFAALV